MKTHLFPIIVFMSFLWSCSSDTHRIQLSDDQAIIENPKLRFSFSAETGTWSLYNKALKNLVLQYAVFGADEFQSNSGQFRFSFSEIPSSGSEKILKIQATGEAGIDLSLTIELGPDSQYLMMRTGVTNKGSETIRIKKLSVISDALYQPEVKPQNLQVLDGNGGAEPTHVRNIPDQKSRNNLLITGEIEGKRTSLTMGGIQYEYFEKFASISSIPPRKDQVFNLMSAKGLVPTAYFNLGFSRLDEARLTSTNARSFTFSTAYGPEVNELFFATEELVMMVHDLKPGQKTVLGFSWIDDSDTRLQSVWVSDEENPDKKYPLLNDRILPSNSKGEEPEFHLINLPDEVLGSGSIRLGFVDVNHVVNAVVSELWIAEGSLPKSEIGHKIESVVSEDIRLNLWAEDPVGKQLLPGQSFESLNDGFYIDPSTADPFESLEKYGQTLQKQQPTQIRRYTFPTVCLWYASHRHYGGEAMATNSSKGAVEEMQHIAEMGFLKYSTAAVRLVPDSYYVNNEQGWWDEEHWQKYGTGQGEKSGYNVSVKAHLDKPYETTAKWAGAVTELGGIPLIYFQTNVRSQDYADQFPDHMLFNESNRIQKNYWPNPNLTAYDFTDEGFLRHMKEVYSTLRMGGVQGLMFDYPRTGWCDLGGFENPEVSTAFAYRNIFKLPYEGLKQSETLIHERNLARGSDVSLGLVASQRVWGDTDNTVPEMITRCGLRWYKNRVVVSYDTDSKNLVKAWEQSRDRLRQVLTMVYVGTGRLVMGNSFAIMNDEVFHDLTRVYPFHDQSQSARPVDAFINEQATIYQFRVNDDWSLLTLYNTNSDGAMDFDIPLNTDNVSGGLALDPKADYHAYDFWNQQYLGILHGHESLKQSLRKDEARMIALHRVSEYPQFISTDRHLMQGYLDLRNVTWEKDSHSLSGEANLISGEDFKLIIATNGNEVSECLLSSGSIRMEKPEPGIVELILNGEGWTRWELK